MSRDLRRTAGVLVLVAALLGCTPKASAPAPSVPTPSASAAPPALDLSSGWGPEAPFVGVNGRPYSGVDRWPQVDRIGSFTVVPTGVVYIDLATTQIVWEDWQHRTVLIGQQPWHPEPDTEQGGVRGSQWGQHRDLVGSASEDLVAWVEQDRGQRGDLVVVQPSTGAILARTAVPGPPELPVVIAGVDAGSVYFATPSDGLVYTSPVSRDVWVWRWAAGQVPEASDLGGGAAYVADVSADVWAVYEPPGTLRFQDAAGEVLSEVPSTYGDRTFFGGGLSPDGRFWYGPAHDEIIATATGEAVPATVNWQGRYAWTGPARLTFVGRPLTVCDATTGACTDPIPIPDVGSCGPGQEYCGYDLPAY